LGTVQPRSRPGLAYQLHVVDEFNSSLRASWPFSVARLNSFNPGSETACTATSVASRVGHCRTREPE
ncbi:MAG: hypothetical protein WA746_00150, partial [Isosphaeraceae bacterium]